MLRTDFRTPPLMRNVDAPSIRLHGSAARAARPEKQSVSVRSRNITWRLVIFLSANETRFNAIGCVAPSGSDFARNSLIVPCSRELVSLLSGIDSLFRLLGNSFVNSWIPSVFEKGFRKKRLNRRNFPVFFSLIAGEVRFSRRPGVVHGKLPGSRLSGAGMLENTHHACGRQARRRTRAGDGHGGRGRGGCNRLAVGEPLPRYGRAK